MPPQGSGTGTGAAPARDYTRNVAADTNYTQVAPDEVQEKLAVLSQGELIELFLRSNVALFEHKETGVIDLGWIGTQAAMPAGN